MSTASPAGGSLLVGILLCDHVSPEFMDSTGGEDYAEIYDAMLTGADPTIRTRAYDVIGGELPDAPDECDGWIITGSRHDAHGDDPWVRDLLAFIRSLAEAETRTVGVCFGHQAVAQALGGSVERAGEWKAGPQQLDVEATEWFDGGAVYVNAMHRDVVTALPPGAVRIGVGTTADQPMFLVGSTMLCLQDHPEFTAAYTQALVDSREVRLGIDVATDATKAIAAQPVDNDRIATWLAAFLTNRPI